MRLGPVVAARAAADPRPGWCAIFTKAYALVSARTPELRRAYLGFPWPRLYESAATVAGVAIERPMGGDMGVGFTFLRRLEAWPVTEVHAAILRGKTVPEAEVGAHRRALRVARLPRPLRRLLWWVGLNVSGRQRVRIFGTFGVTAMAGTGSTSFQLLSPQTTTLYYGRFDDTGGIDVRLAFDHRVFDGGVVAQALADLETALRTELHAELVGLRARATHLRAAA
jgi:hypothetical protein